MIPFLDLKYINKLYIDEIKDAILDVLNSGWFILGENVKNFEISEVNPLKELGDFSTIEDSYNKIGYGRFFNKITIKNKFVLKKSIDKNYSHLIKKEQKELMLKLEKLEFFPEKNIAA